MIRHSPPPAALLVLFLMPLSAVADDTFPAVRVMSFNIRYGTADDGENHWDRRREFVARTIATFEPDLLGTQETLGFQKDFLDEHLPEHEAFGAGREDGTDKGEMTAVFYRRHRFEKLDAGHFWLSETPDVPGSKSWDSALPRMVTWLKLKDRQAGGAVLWLFNTHFDHRGQQARIESARQLREKVIQLAAGEPAIVTGDFNAGEGSDPYRTLFAPRDDNTPLLRDTYRIAHPERNPTEGTFSGFRAEPSAGARIDWIACTPGWQIESADINRTSQAGRTPSDHLPVTTVLRYGK